MVPVPRAKANGIEIEYEAIGPESGRPLLLVAGLGSQLISWDDEFCGLLVERGFRVIRYDNRDAGLSTWPDAEYTLDDMAADGAALLDAVGASAAHVVGVSMGGFIAQLMALNHPEKVLTLTSIMSGPNGEDGVPPTPDGAAVLLVERPESREDQVRVGLWAKQKLLGPSDPYDEAYELPRIERAIDRAYHPVGFARQLRAIMGAPGRLDRLRNLGVPALVIHGQSDILVPVENGRRVAGAIPGARLMLVEGMGHDLPKRVWAQIADAIAALARQASPAC
jgi:pimeloyl-ACP methyl ester carboxylesterase